MKWKQGWCADFLLIGAPEKFTPRNLRPPRIYDALARMKHCAYVSAIPQPAAILIASCMKSLWQPRTAPI